MPAHKKSRSEKEMVATIESSDALAGSHPDPDSRPRLKDDPDEHEKGHKHAKNPHAKHVLSSFIVPLLHHVKSSKTELPLSPAVRALKEALDHNGILAMYFHEMRLGANSIAKYLMNHDAEKYKEFANKEGDFLELFESDAQLLVMISIIVSATPRFNDTGLVGLPLNGLLCMCINTHAGQTLFHNAEFNKYLKAILMEWQNYLWSSDSLDLLDTEKAEQDGSWVSKAAIKACMDGIDYDANDRYLGYHSWNEFFTRRFKKDARPFDEDPMVICNGCETGAVDHDDDLQLERAYWIKAQKYSLVHLFDGDRELAEHFVGGTLYQGYLSATHYHRWHAPCSGELVTLRLIAGTYYAQYPSYVGAEHGDPVANEYSQPYIAHTAARVIFIIRNEHAGLVAFIPIGMTEVSTCVIKPGIHEGMQIKKGEEVGHFLFGGSTHLVICQKDRVKLAPWARKVNNFSTTPHKLGTELARIVNPVKSK